MADEQKKYPYPTKEFLQELTDQIVQWVYNNFALKSEAKPPTNTADADTDDSAAVSEALMSAADKAVSKWDKEE